MTRILLALAAALPLAAQHNVLTPKEAAEGWILLFDGQSMFGWTPIGEPQWAVDHGAIVALPTSQKTGWLRSGSQFADYVLKLEFRTREHGNSGVFLRAATEGEPHVTGYELQIWTGNEKFPTGSLVNHVTTRKGKFNGDTWNQYEVTVRGDHWVVALNRKKVLDAREGKTKSGHIGLQSNKDKIEFRNIKLKPLGGTPLFDGKSLAGWRKVETPRAKEPPVWSVKDGAIHVEKGPGQIETESVYGDFILQMDIRTNPKDANHHPNSGVFFRGDANGFWTGYESQIRNEFKNSDPSQPVDFGTGGVYFHQPARRVVARDGAYFTKTIVARGRHIAVWIDGYPVADWQDPHPEGKLVRNKEARLGAGPISLQAHDPTTNLDFRNIRIAPFPK
jgi:hypothetical protein